MLVKHVEWYHGIHLKREMSSSDNFRAITLKVAFYINCWMSLF